MRKRELWKCVPETRGLYEVSDRGRVRRVGGRVLRPQTQSRGYKFVTLSVDGESRQRLIHRLVLLAFRGPAPEGMEAAHANGARHDCRLANLAWKTPKQNAADKLRHDTNNGGERNGQSKLRVKEVHAIRQQLARGTTQYALAARYGVSQTAISHIKRGEKWAAY